MGQSLRRTEDNNWSSLAAGGSPCCKHSVGANVQRTNYFLPIALVVDRLLSGQELGRQLRGAIDGVRPGLLRVGHAPMVANDHRRRTFCNLLSVGRDNFTEGCR